MNPDWMFPELAELAHAKTPAQREWAERQAAADLNRARLHQKAVKRRAKQKKNAKRSKK